MFEALFILTTLDAGTRVGRYLLQDLLGHIWKPLGQTSKTSSAWLASVLVVGVWGWFLIQGVRDPLGGINSLWPLFGIANQLLASIALCLSTTVILKMQLRDKGRPLFACVTLVPLLWLLAVTMTAGVEKIFHPNPKIGFLAAARAFSGNPALHFNALLDTVVTGLLLLMILSIFLLSVREWVLLLARLKDSRLSETEAISLPGYAVAEAGPRGSLSLLMLALMLIKELSGENASHRTREAQPAVTAERAYLQVAHKRFDGIHRCC
jgi:carbon starvation protein